VLATLHTHVDCIFFCTRFIGFVLSVAVMVIALDHLPHAVFALYVTLAVVPSLSMAYFLNCSMLEAEFGRCSM